MIQEEKAFDTGEPPGESRRSVLAWLGSLAMVGGLLTAYGSLAAFIGRFLYPSRPARQGWLFVTEVSRLEPGKSLLYQLPDGSPVHVRRSGESGELSALSSTCPHLGCQVHWEAHNNRFFCPCHNGVFNPEGVATAGPPADAGQSLLEYPLKVEGGLVFLRTPLDRLVDRTEPGTGCAGCPGRRRT